MKSRITTLFFLVGLSAIPAHGGFVSGNDLLRYCESGGHLDYGVCAGYILGVADSLDREYLINSRLQRECTAKGSTRDQIVMVVKNHMNKHPEYLHLTAMNVVQSALIDAFGCDD
jgi:hypothetical protein